MHILCEVGHLMHCVVSNQTHTESGPFMVEFYVGSRSDSLRRSYWRVYGSRVEVPNLKQKTSMLIKVPREARCPLQAPLGDGKLYALVRAATSEDIEPPSGLELSRLAVKGRCVDYHNQMSRSCPGVGGSVSLPKILHLKSLSRLVGKH